MRHATPKERKLLGEQFEIFPMLATPVSLWARATELGQACRDKGHTAGTLDLLIAVVARAHGAAVITFDEDFEKIGDAVGLQVKLLRRPV